MAKKEKETILNRSIQLFWMGIITAFTVFAARSAVAESYGPLSFMLPPGWKCAIVKSSDVCMDKSSAKPAGVLVVTFKNKTPTDSLLFYKNQLGSPRPLRNGEIVTPSEVKLVREITINGQQWVEAVHHNSEIRGFYTHYLATVADPYALLVSITVNDQEYADMMTKLDPTINSMKIAIPQTPSQSQPAMAPQPQSALPQVPTENGIQPHKNKIIIYIGIGLVAAIFLLIYAILK